MFKNLFTVLSALSILFSIFNLNLSVEAIKESKPQIQAPKSTQVFQDKTKQLKSKPKIINGELDVEPDVKMTKEQKQEFNKCKKEEKQRRSKRNKNKPTSCIKIPSQINEEFVDQVYTTLFDQIQEQQDIEDKKDINKELPLSDFIDIKLIEKCYELENNLVSTSTNFAQKSDQVHYICNI